MQEKQRKQREEQKRIKTKKRRLWSTSFKVLAIKTISNVQKIALAQEVYNESFLKQLTKNKQLTNSLREQRSPEQVLQIFKQNQQHINHIHICTAAMSLGYMMRQLNRKKIQLEEMERAYNYLIQQMNRHMDVMNAWDLCNCIWSLGKAAENKQLTKKLPQLQRTCTLLVSRALQLRKQFQGQTLANIIWAMAKIGRNKNDVLVQELVKESLQKQLYHFIPQEISNILWAIAKMSFEDLHVINKYLNMAKQCIKQMPPQNLSNVMWTLKKLRYQHTELQELIEDIIVERIKKFNSQDISNFALAFLDLGLKNQEILDILVQQFTQQKFWKAQEFANLLYAVSCMGYPIQKAQNFFNQAGFRKRYYQPVYKFIELRQIRRAYLEYQSKGQKLIIPHYLLRTSKLQSQYQALVSSRLPVPQLNEIYDVIKQKYPPSQKRVLVHHAEVHINICIQSNNQNIAIFISSEMNYLRNKPQIYIGSTKCYYQFVERIGWKVITIDPRQWKSEQYRIKLLWQIQYLIDNKVNSNSWSSDYEFVIPSFEE
eukprot:TRINITY_DN16343_c0_g1_i3.p1 TRINITY_DN16343_c0_g1~~TRINITY_DN16343_c0_g1_i3.p1  ORF type:complete len:548 (-),score=17.33 TRINITY_DN16343_c0_g1_i3:560-2182(-)